MTKEELEKEAEEYAGNTYEMCSYSNLPYASDRRARQQAFLAGAEPREKRIAELEKENAELKRENRGIKTCANCDEYVIGRCCNYPNGVCHHWKLSEKYKNDDELTKAKELIKTLLLIADNKVSQMEFQLCVADAKQFLNSEVEK